MKFSETSPELRKERIDHINLRWGQLYELEKETGQTALHYLFLTNAGGAAATLAFIGSIGRNNIEFEAKIALGLFVLGLIFSGISRAKQFYHMSGLFKNWKSLVSSYFSDKKTWEEVGAEDDTKAVDNFWDYGIPYISFGCFIGGSAVGFIALL